MLALSEALARLRGPQELEDFSALGGAGLLVVELGDGRIPGASTLAALQVALTELPCPSVALVPDPAAPEASQLAAAFDVVVDNETGLAALAAEVRRAPLAALALVQLLRSAESRGVGAALVAESFAYSALQAGPEWSAWFERRTPVAPPKPPQEPALRVRRRGECLELRFNRPERRNAFSSQMRDALVEGLSLALADGSIEEVVLCGEGPAFCSGGDLDEFGTSPDPATDHAIRSTRNPARLLARCADRVRAEVHGACIGAGIELAAFARCVRAREDAFFELPELGMGLIPGAGGTVSLPRRIGRQRTAWLALTGQRIDAGQALEWGLVDEVVSATGARAG